MVVLRRSRFRSFCVCYFSFKCFILFGFRIVIERKIGSSRFLGMFMRLMGILRFAWERIFFRLYCIVKEGSGRLRVLFRMGFLIFFGESNSYG